MFPENYDPAVLLCIEYQRFEFGFGALKFGDQMDSFSRQQPRGAQGDLCKHNIRYKGIKINSPTS